MQASDWLSQQTCDQLASNVEWTLNAAIGCVKQNVYFATVESFLRADWVCFQIKKNDAEVQSQQRIIKLGCKTVVFY